MSWRRWSDDVQNNKKILALTVPARWLNFAVVQECGASKDARMRDGFVSRITAEAVARGQGVATKCVAELLQANFGNPLWHKKGDRCASEWCRKHLPEIGKDEYLIHDFQEYNPPKSADSRDRVARHREKLRTVATGVTVTEPLPGNEPPGEPTEGVRSTSLATRRAERRIRVLDTERENERLGARAAAVGAWWATRSGHRTAPGDLCRRIAKFDIDLTELIAHLEEVAQQQEKSDDPVRSLIWFTRGEGISRLHKLQSESHASRNPVESRGGMTALSSELRAFVEAAG